MSTHRHLRRTDLFLLRVWTEDAGDGSGKTQWRGKVLRVVDGESHQFDDWQGLLTLLSLMLAGAERDRPADRTPQTVPHSKEESRPQDDSEATTEPYSEIMPC
jgi:hypothetical protein